MLLGLLAFVVFTLLYWGAIYARQQLRPDLTMTPKQQWLSGAIGFLITAGLMFPIIQLLNLLLTENAIGRGEAVGAALSICILTVEQGLVFSRRRW